MNNPFERINNLLLQLDARVEVELDKWVGPEGDPNIKTEDEWGTFEHDVARPLFLATHEEINELLEEYVHQPGIGVTHPYYYILDRDLGDDFACGDYVGRIWGVYVGKLEEEEINERSKG